MTIYGEILFIFNGYRFLFLLIFSFLKGKGIDFFDDLVFVGILKYADASPCLIYNIIEKNFPI